MAGYIYLLGSTTFGWYKIGKSRKPEVRIKTLGVLLPFRIEVIGLWRAERYNQIESELHEKYAAQRINGEWFRFSETEVKRLIEEMGWFTKVDAFSGFTNAANDAPEGMKLKIKIRPNLSPEEHEKRKQQKIAERNERKAKRNSASGNDARGPESTLNTETIIQ